MCQSSCHSGVEMHAHECCRGNSVPLSKQGKIRMYESHLEQLKEKARDLEEYIAELKKQ